MKLVVGFIIYSTSAAKYLPYFLDSLKEQTFKDFKIIVADNNEEQENANKQYEPILHIISEYILGAIKN